METKYHVLLAMHQFQDFLITSPRKGMETARALASLAALDSFLITSPRKGMETASLADCASEGLIELSNHISP